MVRKRQFAAPGVPTVCPSERDPRGASPCPTLTNAGEKLITDELRDYGNEVRIAGNEAAHPEDIGDVTQEEAAESLDFMNDFLRYAVAMPERRKARQAARAEAATTNES